MGAYFDGFIKVYVEMPVTHQGLLQEVTEKVIDGVT